MSGEISIVPAWGADVRGSAPTPGSLFPDHGQAQRGSPAPSCPGMLLSVVLLHVPLGVSGHQWPLLGG